MESEERTKFSYKTFTPTAVGVLKFMVKFGMLSYDIFFFSIVFFLLGILGASLGMSFLIMVVAVMLLAMIFLFLGIFFSPENLSVLAILTIFILLGAGYYRWDDWKYKNIKIDFNKEINFSGLVIDDPQLGLGSQTFSVKLYKPYQGRILIKLPLYPNFKYGDEIDFQGVVKSPSLDSYGNYLAKEKISGLVNFPQAKLKSSGLGSVILSKLFELKHRVLDSFQKVLAPEPAAFLAGLTFGEKGKFTSEFKKAMSLSGTTHLAVLSGQHIVIISAIIFGLLSCFFSPLLTAVFTLLIILGFIGMTGFEFTAVRAAIMGAAVLLAKLIGRIYDPRNIIVLAALVINLFNPKVLVFDLGFQLSFLAVLGLIYLLPALRKLLKFKEGPGFLAWRENFLMTLSAQLATAPLLMINFGNFSPGALIANILILLAIPLTMILGFLIGFFYFLSYYLALILGWLAALLLNYEIFVIELFAKIALPFNPTLNFWGILAYYLILIGLIVWAKKSGKISL